MAVPLYRLPGPFRAWTDAIRRRSLPAGSPDTGQELIWKNPTRGGRTMLEAVIVATARSPIGRAGKGSLVSIRPDNLAAQIVAAALAKVPQLDPRDVGDLILGCGLPGSTVNRYCSSSLQTTRMAFHAIKAGEGDAYISAGVECVSRFGKGSSDS